MSVETVLGNTMEDLIKVSRREFIKLATLGAGTIAMGTAAISLIEGCAAPSRSTRQFFSDDEYRLVEAIAEQIIPTDNWPGGRDAGVANYIDIQLAGPLRRFQEQYRTGLAAINESCVGKFGERFEKLAWDTQTGFLLDMESGKLSSDRWNNGFGARFFELLRSHSLQGFYGNPRHGGNRDFVSYRMMGLTPLQTVGQNRYGA